MLISALRAFGGANDTIIEQYATLMVDTVSGDQKSTTNNFFSYPIFGETEDLAYLLGSRAVNSLGLGSLGIAQVKRKFKQALSNRGLSAMDSDLQVAQFQVYYWSMAICLTYGKDRERAYRKARKAWSVVNQLRDRASIDAIAP